MDATLDGFLELLRARIAERNVTQVAASIGVTEATIRNWLSGNYEPKVKHYHRLLAISGLKSIVVPADAQNSHARAV